MSERNISALGLRLSSYKPGNPEFKNSGYWFALEPTHDNRMMFTDESFCNDSDSHCIAKGHFESQVFTGLKTPIDLLIVSEIKKWCAYHFHDTSDTSLIKQLHGINDNIYLRPDASNLAAYLYLLKNKYELHYQRIVKTVRLVAPFFKDFHLRPSTHNEDFIELEWIENGEDIPYKAHRLSDGTLRFICLATIFLQPEEMQPETIFVDEPELGLHPFAIVLLASLINSVSKTKQIKQIYRKCHQDKKSFVSTMFDYYGLPNDFPGKNKLPNTDDPIKKVTYLESEFNKDISLPNFIPNFLVFEFEALLFTKTEAFGQWFETSVIEKLAQVRNTFSTPEHINDNPKTAPSKRIT